ncbi:aldehyde dehydrogenase family protein [Rhodococcus maanshanensis]|uniref:Aldehyde dehydrogenase n=1 Tax=Rhodococcus maanshanensis TaxID=183556 RepID=A0A1H7KWN2_9NOCA|nr:aldehyde dehydrogenase family protein [Rhodococcus maanshanensis]SEK90954.1 aldehyde dehydrogenase (NAD+) [Rhodococcus maanshanensis]
MAQQAAEKRELTETAGSPAGAASIESLDPRTDAVIATYPVADANEVARVVERARPAARWWESLGFDGRKRWLLDWKKAIASDAQALAAVISRETGKPQGDALLEVMLTVEHLDWAARNAAKVLGKKKVPSGLVSANQEATVRYQPLGVVGVIGPWNYPLYTPMGSISYALAAGNAVVFKPSELTPGVAVWIADKWQALVPNQPVLQVITGDGGTGAALCRAGVDKVAFTGSTPTAKKVMALCAETLTPMVAECGGKDAMLVDADADLEEASNFAVFGAMGNAGQTCVGVERIYVADGVFDTFVQKVAEKAERLRPGGAPDSSYGPMTMARQSEVVREQIDDALARGGRAVLGGPESIRAPFVEPVILVDVPEDSIAVREETFGPTVVINRVADLDEGIAAANASKYGLGASIFTRDRKRAVAAAERLRAGVVTINSVLGFAGVAALPFGGVGESGFGRIHGADGLREFSRAKSVARQKYRAPLNLLSMERKARDMKIAAWLLKTRHGRG